MGLELVRRRRWSTRSPAIPASRPRPFASRETEADQPEQEDDHGDDPEGVNGESEPPEEHGQQQHQQDDAHS